MLKLECKTKSKTYPVYLGEMLDFEQLLSPFIEKRKICLVTCDFIKKNYLTDFIASNNFFEPLIITVPSGESAKSFNQVEAILATLLLHNFDRDSVVISLGGGAVSDLVGFCCSIYMRGIAWVCIATTLLSAVDAAVGGKTAINFKSAKNSIGAFYEPEAVFIDVAFFKTLSNRDFYSAMSEVVKCALLESADFFNFLQVNQGKIVRRDTKYLLEIISFCLKLKIKLVEQDLHDKGMRQLLNMGHTIGHALEALARGSYTHGEAVAIGLVLEAEIAVAIDMLLVNDKAKIIALLEAFNLPTTPTQNIINFDAVLDQMLHDKKRNGNLHKFILPTSIGKVRQCRLSSAEVLNIFELA